MLDQIKNSLLAQASPDAEKPSNDAGYSLIELVVALALMALLSVPLYDGTRFATDSWVNSHKRINEFEDIILARNRLRQWIKAAYPYDLNRKSGQTPAFSGDSQNLSIVSAAHPNPREDSFFRIILSLSGGGDLEVVINADFEDQPLDGLPEGEDEKASLLLSNIETFTISYLKPGNAARADEWLIEWNDPVAIPKAVKVELSLKDSRFNWPPLIVPLEIDEWAHCGYDSVSKLCRTGVTAG